MAKKNFIPISSQVINDIFGSSSQMYSNVKKNLENLWEDVKDELDIKTKFDFWLTNVRILYGYKPDLSLFIDHTYLTILAKIIVYLKFNNKPDKDKIIKVINGNYFVDKGITNFLSEDFSIWLFNPKIENQSISLFWDITIKLTNYDFSEIDEDIFRQIYEDIVERKERHKTGEYYTPKWLVQLILNEVITIKKGKPIPKILDPTCGSGTFIYHAIKIFKKKKTPIKDIIKNIAGIDINPLATIIAKANYLIAISNLISNSKQITLPIYTKDCLRGQDLFDYEIKIHKYDIIIGNPPWVVMRSMKNKEYQNFLKKEVLDYQLLEHKDTHLFTQMELATLSFCKCADLYLKRGGIIAFVMPRSVLAGTIHHINFRRFRKPHIRLLKIIDLEDVTPLFNIPACVLIGIKGSATKYPVSLERYTGELNNANAKLTEAKEKLSMQVHTYTPPDFSIQPSYYFDKFKVGASIFPRSLYFVDCIHCLNSHFLSVKTSEEILRIVKEPWKVALKGEIENNFLYATLLAWEMVSFGYVRLQPVVLPVIEDSNGYKLLDVNKLHTETTKWFKKTQEIWDKRKTLKSQSRFPTLLDRLNYNNLLTIQNPSVRYVVLYNATGTNLVSCVIDRHIPPYFEVNGNRIKPEGFIVDVKTWFFETNNELEAHYLSAVFNSEVVSKMIKPLQPRGLFGARAIHRRPLLLPIPKFDENNNLHIELANISKNSHKKIKFMTLTHKNNIRTQIKQRLKDEMIEINHAMSELCKRG